MGRRECSARRISRGYDYPAVRYMGSRGPILTCILWHDETSFPVILHEQINFLALKIVTLYLTIQYIIELYRCGKKVRRRKNSQWLYTMLPGVLRRLPKILKTRLEKLTSLLGMYEYNTQCAI